jgi:hypothetical protein
MVGFSFQRCIAGCLYAVYSQKHVSTAHWWLCLGWWLCLFSATLRGTKYQWDTQWSQKKTDVWCDLGYAWGCILTSNKCDLAFGNFGNYPHLDMMWHDVANSSPWFSPFNPEAPYGCWLTKSASSARRRSISNTAQENEQGLKRSWGHCPELLSYWTGQFICDIYICYITMSELIMRILSLSYWDMLQVWTTDS